jgi:hypothetical protein
LSVEDVLKYGVIPAAVRGDTLAVLVRDPLETEALAEVTRLAKHPIKQHIVPDFRFDHALAELYGVRPPARIKAVIDRFPVKIGRTGMSGLHAAVPGGPAKILERLGVGWSPDQLGRFLAHSDNRDDIVDAILASQSVSAPLRDGLSARQAAGFRGPGCGGSAGRLSQRRGRG